jgi:hypothetical protein
VSDANDLGEFVDFPSRNEHRIAPESVRMLAPTDPVQLTKGQTFCPDPWWPVARDPHAAALRRTRPADAPRINACVVRLHVVTLLQ